jgi:cytochrome c oxidase assembly protein Cox11
MLRIGIGFAVVIVYSLFCLKSPVGYKRRKHEPYVTYWGF